MTLDSKKELYEVKDAEQMLEWVKQAVINGVRAVCASIIVHMKNLESE